MILYHISSSSISTNLHGDNNDITTTVSADQTNYVSELLDIKKYDMNNKRTIEDFKTLLSSRFNDDIELMAHALGIPSNEARSYLSGISSIPEEIISRIENYIPKGGDYFQFGNRVEINNSGDGYQQSFADILESSDENFKRLKTENSYLKKIIKEQGELIASLKEANKLLKNK